MKYYWHSGQTRLIFSKTIKEIIQTTIFGLLTDSDLSVHVFPTIDLFLGEIVSELYILMNRGNRNKLTFWDLQNLVFGGSFNKINYFYNLNFQTILDRHFYWPGKYFFRRKKGRRLKKYKGFLSQNWYLSCGKYKNDSKKKKNFTDFPFSSNFLFSRLSPDKKIMVRYIIEKLKRGTYKDQQICLNFLLKSKNINQIFPFLIFHLRIFLKNKNRKSGTNLVTLIFLRSLITNFSFNKDSFSRLILPFFFEIIFGKLGNEKNVECRKSKVYSSELVGYYYKKMKSRYRDLYYKIAKIFTKAILSKKKTFLFTDTPFTGLSFMGAYELELIVFPHILSPIKTYNRKKKETF